MSLKSILKPVYHRLPVQLRAPGIYWKTLRLLRESQFWDEQRIQEYQTERLRSMLLHCEKNVPYYRALFREIGFDPSQFRHTSELSKVPTLDVETIKDRQQELIATNIKQSQWTYFTFGSTLGRPLGLYNLRDSGWRERAFIEVMWSRVGFMRAHKRAILRSSAVTNRRGWFYDAKERACVFSSFRLTSEAARQYSDVMKEHGLEFLHCYPSSMVDFVKCLQEAGCGPPRFKALLVGSENLYPGQQELAESFFNCRMFTWMGHSENTVLAGGCELNNFYHVFPEYGYLETLSEDGKAADNENETGELVGTSFYNRVMPLIRYRTGDWGVIGPRQCPCGRQHRLLREVRGRRDQEVLIGRLRNRIFITVAVNMNRKLFDNVRQFQFYQTVPGVAEIRIVRGPGFTDGDGAIILKEMKEKIGDTLDLRLQFVSEIAATQRGKFRLIVQECEDQS